MVQDEISRVLLRRSGGGYLGYGILGYRRRIRKVGQRQRAGIRVGWVNWKRQVIQG